MIEAGRPVPLILGAGTVKERGRRNLAALDGIRGAAVLAVMMSHFERFLPAVGLLNPIKAIFTFGWVGVDLFFVLSGFLITGILIETRGALNYFRSFYARRFLRIFPIYYATLAVVLLVIALVPGIPNVPPPQERWLYFAYLDNWIPLWTKSWPPPNVLGHFWSLAVEEQFYIVWPLSVLLLSIRGIFRTALLLSLLALIVRCFFVSRWGPSGAVMYSTITRMDSLLMGAVAATMFVKPGGVARPKHLSLISGAALTVWSVCIVITTWHASPNASFSFVCSVGYTIMAIGFAAFVLGAALGDGETNVVQRIFTNGALKRIGKYSYGMYVYHVPLLGICELVILRHAPHNLSINPLFAIIYVGFLTAATFMIAAVSYRFVERPLLGLKERFEPTFTAQTRSTP